MFIRFTMSLSGTVLDDEVEFLFQPPCLLSDGVRSVPQPGQGMVRAYFEVNKKPILFEVLQEMHYG